MKRATLALTLTLCLLPALSQAAARGRGGPDQ